MKDLSTNVLELPEATRPPMPPSPRVEAARAPALVYREEQWRQPPDAETLQARRPDSIVISRWTCDGSDPVSVSHDGDGAHHCISLALRSGSVRLLCGGMPVFDGRITAGSVQVTAPGVASRAEYGSACDLLHLFVPQVVLAACYEDQFGHAHPGELLLDDPFVHTDPALERLGQALAVAHTQDPGLGRMFADSVALAIVARVVANHFQRAATNHRTQTALPQWRLRRAIAFIDDNLAAPIGLADIASSTGLTRMYFAAQFRRATGMRPHEYLVRRRIEHAQDLLRRGQGSVLEVAMRSGFRSQAHFTTVFKRFVGDTPYCWRVKVTSTPGSSHV